MNKLVYSTDPDWQPESQASDNDNGGFPDDGTLRLRRETKGRKGAGVVCIYGVPNPQIGSLAKQLKKQLGTGGAVKKGVIEIQGDRVSQITELLIKAGYKAKQVGG
ncbi:MAG: stress response translation initiation inhibitor YciH [Aeromonadales bacterium]|nr:stress response translation initiation inhibitor YciH [Aeromonadales bacterium]